jgi:hypothetical protein
MIALLIFSVQIFLYLLCVVTFLNLLLTLVVSEMCLGTQLNLESWSLLQ